MMNKNTDLMKNGVGNTDSYEIQWVIVLNLLSIYYQTLIDELIYKNPPLIFADISYRQF